MSWNPSAKAPTADEGEGKSKKRAPPADSNDDAKRKNARKSVAYQRAKAAALAEGKSMDDAKELAKKVLDQIINSRAVYQNCSTMVSHLTCVQTTEAYRETA